MKFNYFTFKQLKNGKYLLTNELGFYDFLSKEDFDNVVGEKFDEIDKGGLGLMIARKNSREMIYNRINDRNILKLKFEVKPLIEEYN